MDGRAEWCLFVNLLFQYLSCTMLPGMKQHVRNPCTCREHAQTKQNRGTHAVRPRTITRQEKETSHTRTMPSFSFEKLSGPVGPWRCLCRGPAPSVSGPGALWGPGALCIGPRQSLTVYVGPRRSIARVGARRFLCRGTVSMPGARSMCRVLCVSGPGALCAGHRMGGTRIGARGRTRIGGTNDR